ncbi:MAG: peptidoglycan DD-metalloendopeptidase family protein [Candidatus Gracilibacteria bacterium]|jgi:murein DD-endopeptidase MepM/ murein hydrolase activator NlpD
MRKFLLLLTVFSLLLAPAGHSFAAVSSLSTLTDAVEQNNLLLQLKQKFAQVEYRYTLIKNSEESVKVNLEGITAKITGTKGVIENLAAQIREKEKQRLSVKRQEEAKKLDTAKTEVEIMELSKELAEEKKAVSSLLSVIYLKRNVYYEDGDVNAVKVLASGNGVSETLQGITYLNLIEDKTREKMDSVSTLSTELAAKWSELREKQSRLSALYDNFGEDLKRITEEKQHQEDLLSEMKGDKAIWESMAASQVDHVDELLSQMRIYGNNIKMLEKSLEETGGGLSPDEKAIVEKIVADMAENYTVTEAAGFLQLNWPVNPVQGISAVFHDGGYAALFGVDHYALDIRAHQGSQIFAPADGVVQDVIYDPNSIHYAYIMVAHRMGVITVYGHISSPAVAIGDYVTRGQLLGLSGGNPGSIGSGVRTTGPHLHMEVWQDGVRMDPLNYLPLSSLAADMLPAGYEEQMKKNLEEQIRVMSEGKE